MWDSGFSYIFVLFKISVIFRLSLLDESLASANLGNDHGFIIKEYYLHWYERPFGEAQSKAMRAYAQIGQYHTTVESRIHLTIFIVFRRIS